LGYWQRDRISKYAELNDLGEEKGNYFQYKKDSDSHKGIAADVDATLQIGKFYVSAGYNLSNYVGKNRSTWGVITNNLNAGVGLFF
jgi:hypothetical protein